ncbi:hypothetical protein CWO89_11270 [Bradyrhizobium sp. Leo170]|nr:hypothetical protein CWO89_11270 [Bradyrhizobium sp. Leo170]
MAAPGKNLQDQRVTLCGRTFHLRTSETMHTESSRKYTAESLERLVHPGG